MEATYAKALFELARREGADQAQLVETLVSHLAETGRLKLLPRIARELRRLDLRASALADTIEIAREEDRADALAATASLGVTADVQVNSSLITGWRARIGKGRIIDRSGKRALLDLYKTIATHA